MRVLAVAAIAGLAMSAACAADDDLSVPRPTVPRVTNAPSEEADDRRSADSPANPQTSQAGADGQQTDEAKADDQQPDEARADDQRELAAGTESPDTDDQQPGTASAGASTPSLSESAPDAVPRDGDLAAADVVLELVVSLDEPIDMAAAPGDEMAWIAERPGRVLRVNLARGEVVETILDITAETGAEGERGLLGIAVSDDWLYASFTDLAGHTRVDAFRRDGDGLGSERRTILRQDQPFRNHNGGAVVFGPDSLLYLGLGDGGSGGDPLDHGQNPATWLGAILRIVPTPEEAQPYAIPTGNPFAAEGSSNSDPTGRPEIFLIGVRNPWRFSFDRATGDLWIADVGQDRYEEVTVLLAANGGGRGANLGWRLREGLHAFAGDEPQGHVDPVWEYDRDDGCSVTGGYVYRGAAIDDLVGSYVFGDYCTARLWAVQISSGIVDFRDLGSEVPGGSLASFGQDAQGELYTLSLNGPVARIVPR